MSIKKDTVDDTRTQSAGSEMPHRTNQGQTLRTPPAPSDLDDYWAYTVSEAAKKKVLAYFAVLGVLVSIVVTLFGVDRIRTLVDQQYLQKIAKSEEEASARVKDLTAAFERKLANLESQVEARSQEFHRVVGVTLTQVSSTSRTMAGLRIDLSSEIGPIRNQGSEGTTTGFSAAYALTAEYKRVLGKSEVFSARSIFVEARRNDEWPGEDYEGSSILGAMKGLKEVGAYLEKDWPYERRKEALPEKKPVVQITAYTRIPSERTDLLVEALQSGKVVVISLQVTDDFAELGEGGKVQLSADPKITGGHSVALVGYDGASDEFTFANMWGTSWGSAGFGLIRRSDLQKLILDAFTLSL